MKSPFNQGGEKAERLEVIMKVKYSYPSKFVFTFDKFNFEKGEVKEINTKPVLIKNESHLKNALSQLAKQNQVEIGYIYMQAVI